MPEKKPRINRLWIVLGTIAAFTMLFTTGFFMVGKTYLFPGPLSALSMKGEPLQGFPNHAAFEQECSHCHAPIHCITDTRCEDCHMDVARQRTSGVGLHSLLPGTDRCQSCHFEHEGRDAVITEFAFMNVDHEKMTGYSLKQHHTNYDGEPMHCVSCHSQDRFISETLDCLTCHVEQDHDGTAERLELYGDDCLSCHDGKGRYADWDHQDIYILDGAHSDVECLDCHVDQVFKGTPTACFGCHEYPEVHSDVFGQDCSRCHTAEAWQPAYLTDHTFDLYHGSESVLDCGTCHINNYVEKTCYECHDHQPDDMQKVHLEEGIIDIGDCASCHPTGITEEDQLLRDSLNGQVNPGQAEIGGN